MRRCSASSLTSSRRDLFHRTRGTAGRFLLVDLSDPSGIPALAEPFYVLFDADRDSAPV